MILICKCNEVTEKSTCQSTLVMSRVYTPQIWLGILRSVDERIPIFEKGFHNFHNSSPFKPIKCSHLMFGNALYR